MKTNVESHGMGLRLNVLLVANRGEIALRIMRSARLSGLLVVAVYSDADRDSPHVEYADQAICLGASAASDSYLSIPKILEAAKTSGAQAVHPGYGFLAENADFARAVLAADLVFVGPSAEAIQSMGNKAEAKKIMRASGVPCIPGYEGLAQDDQTLLAQAQDIGFPLMIKAAAGGGGRGMRLVRNQLEVLPALQAARSEALTSFGSDQLILERAILNARHIEVQIFGDQHGNVIHLGERDCSVQRRHQKLIEESPSPAVSDALRAQMGETAVAAGRAIQYVGAGTIEFLLGDDGQFWFMEMNTRLQVEHGVTELLTGLDLVQWQLSVAMGKPLPLQQDEVKWVGHAMEVRLCAEDTAAGFLPQTGRVLAWEPAINARTDAALKTGLQVSAFYDSMLAKIMVHGDTREACMNNLRNACHQTVLLGLRHNLPFLKTCLEHPRFQAGQATTTFIDDQFDSPSLARGVPPQAVEFAAAMIFTKTTTGNRWTNALGLSHIAKVAVDDATPKLWFVETSGPKGAVSLRVDKHKDAIVVHQVSNSGSTLVFELNHKRQRVRFETDAQSRLWLQYEGIFYCACDLTHSHQPKALAVSANAGIVRAPLAGRVANVSAVVGQTIKVGAPLIAIESMKMEHTLYAETDGLIEELLCNEGDQVMAGRILVRIKVNESAALKESA